MIIGGKGGLGALREAVEGSGYNFRFTKSACRKARARRGPIALVIVVGHGLAPLLTRAREWRREDPIFLKSPSISAVRQTVASRSGMPQLSDNGAA